MEISINTALGRFGITRVTLNKWLKSGAIKYRKLVNGRVMVDGDSLDKYVVEKIKNR